MSNISHKRQSIFSEVSRQENMGFGLVAILILCIYICLKGDSDRMIIVIIVLSTIALVCPSALTPLAALWHELSRILGKITTPLLLGITYLLIVTPVGLLQRIFKKDSMQMRKFRKGKVSALIDRDHEYKPEDFINTF